MIGSRTLFYPCGSDMLCQMHGTKGPLAATVAAENEDGTVNLCVLLPSGLPHPVQGVRVHRGPGKADKSSSYCTV